MFEMLAAYLEATATPEQRAVCLDAYRALIDADITDQDFLIQQELAVAESLDGDFLVHLQDGLLKPIFVDQLGDFGVRLSAEASLAQYVDVFKALHLIDNFEAQDTIVDLCESPEGSEAALADILELLGQGSSTDYLMVLEHVSASLLDRIQETCRQDMPAARAAAPVERARNRINVLLKLGQVQSAPTLMVDQWLQDGGLIGIAFELLVTPYRTTLDEMQPSALALELVGFACACRSPDDRLHGLIKQELARQTTRDSFALTAIDSAVTRLLQQVLHA